jgi:anionic cell wall polymer biosynthesis LytR-Cps2A-Psr (LCP) family protein
MVCLLVLALLAISVGADPCDCMTLTISGAGMTEINGTYTYTPFVSSQPGWEDGYLWLGPEYSIATIEGNWVSCA